MRIRKRSRTLEISPVNVLVVLTLAALVACGGGSSSGTGGGGNPPPQLTNQFAFVQFPAGGIVTGSVALINNDGSGLITPTYPSVLQSVEEDPYGKGAVALASSTGTQVFYADLSNLSSLTFTALTNDGDGKYSPQISWDGKTVVYVDVSNQTISIALISTAGGSPTIIHEPSSGSAATPSFAPNGKILFSGFNDFGDSRTSIGIMNPDGSGVTRLTTPSSNWADFYPTVSADGKMFTFSRCSASGLACDIWIANIDGSSPKQLTTDGTNWESRFVNGKIVFCSWRDTGNDYQTQIYSMNPDGTNVQRLTNDSLDDSFDSWMWS
jgi:Tol biopolymer transport system component